MKELEIKDMMARHRQELGDKEATINSVRLKAGSGPFLVYLQVYVEVPILGLG